MRSTKRSNKEPYITDSDGKTNEKAITIDDDSEESLDDYFDEEYNKKVTQESTKTNPSKRRVTRRFKIANKLILAQQKYRKTRCRVEITLRMMAVQHRTVQT
uniref:Uncharacterized protein n=1 Tax=Oryza rufipogon TaxID=4529 RepID=A0A0E0RBX0_ORYRU